MAQQPDSQGTQREVLIRWDDPAAAAAAGLAMSGLEYLTAMKDGRLPMPPIAHLMGLEAVEVEEGRVVFACTPDERVYNPIGVVHGGLGATLLDSAMGCAVHSTLPARTGYSTLEIKVNFVRTITADTGRVRGEGSILHRGSRVATAEGKVVAEQSGKLLAHATTTCMILA